MTARELLQWQWDGYQTYHQSRANLLIHIIVVPLFMISNVGLLVAPFQGSVVLGVLSLVGTVASVALQGHGHRQEKVPPVPFTSPANALSRIFLEQWISFPRFVVSGGWLRALRDQAP